MHIFVSTDFRRKRNPRFPKIPHRQILDPNPPNLTPIIPLTPQLHPLHSHNIQRRGDADSVLSSANIVRGL